MHIHKTLLGTYILHKQNMGRKGLLIDVYERAAEFFLKNYFNYTYMTGQRKITYRSIKSRASRLISSGTGGHCIFRLRILSKICLNPTKKIQIKYQGIGE